MNQPKLKIYRKRYLPDEVTYLKDDVVLRYEPGSLLITSWQSLKPRSDIYRGVSAYLVDKGVKISKIYNRSGRLAYWYCDIINIKENEAENTFSFEDLLFDVIVYADGSYRVADIGEAADAYEQNLITREQLVYAMHVLERLLETIVNGDFILLQKIVNNAE